MQTATFEDIAAQGASFLLKLSPSEPVSILHEGKIVALMMGTSPHPSEPRPLGCYAGQINISPDFNEPLPEWDDALESPLP
jgi:hypothetical protein